MNQQIGRLILAKLKDPDLSQRQVSSVLGIERGEVCKLLNTAKAAGLDFWNEEGRSQADRQRTFGILSAVVDAAQGEVKQRRQNNKRIEDFKARVEKRLQELDDAV